MKGRAASVLLVPISPIKMWDPLVSWSMETICMWVVLRYGDQLELEECALLPWSKNSSQNPMQCNYSVVI
jgi:hypothetical protein